MRNLTKIMRKGILLGVVSLIFVLTLFIFGYEQKKLPNSEWTGFKIETWKLVLFIFFYAIAVAVIISYKNPNNRN